MRIATIIVTFNRLNLLKECVEGILRQTESVDAIYIVNNASTDGTSLFIEDLAKKTSNINVLTLPFNIGGAGGFHAGLTAAVRDKYDWYWLMDDDAEPEPDALEKLTAWIENDDSIVAVTSAVVDTDGGIQNEHQGFVGEKFCINPASIALHRRPRFQIDYFSFVGPLLRHSAVERVGLPLAKYFIWHDDKEYSLRLSKIGRLFCIPSSRLIHKDQLMSGRVKHKNLRKRINSWKIPVDLHWKYLCGIRNEIHMIRTHALNCRLIIAKIIIFQFIRLVLSGSINRVIAIHYIDYIKQGLGVKEFVTITPAQWKKIMEHKC